MKNKIVADSSCDLNVELEKELNIDLVPFKIDIDDNTFIDDENIDMSKFVEMMLGSPNPIRTSCPSPGDFKKTYMEAHNTFVVTISSKLSGTFNSAILAKDMLLEELPNKFIHVFDSKSASIGETLVAIKINELLEMKLCNIEIVEKVENYIENMKTYFISQDLSNLIKNGRISRTKGLIASVLNIVPIMGERDGEIELFENVRGKKKAFNRLVTLVANSGVNFEEKILGISHSNALEKALKLKEEIMKICNFKDVIIVETKGLSTAYVNNGGIILSF